MKERQITELVGSGDLSKSFGDKMLLAAMLRSLKKMCFYVCVAAGVKRGRVTP